MYLAETSTKKKGNGPNMFLPSTPALKDPWKKHRATFTLWGHQGLYFTDDFKTLTQDYHDRAIEEYLITVPPKRRPSHVRCFVKFSRGLTQHYKGISWTLSTLMSRYKLCKHQQLFSIVSYEQKFIWWHAKTHPGLPYLKTAFAKGPYLLEQPFSNRNRSELQEGGHRNHGDRKWQN